MSLLFFLCVRVPTILAILWQSWKQRRKQPQARRENKSILIVRLDELGDLVLTTPLFRELKRTLPGSRCTIVTRENFREVLTTNPHIDEVLTVPAISQRWIPGRLRSLVGTLAFWRRQLSGRNFDIAISPRWDVDEHLATLLCVLSRAEVRVGYTEHASTSKERMNRGFDRAFTTCLPAGPVQHEVLRNLAIVEAVTGGSARSDRLEILVSDSDRQYATGVLAGLPSNAVRVALGIGAGSVNRRWPLERFAETIAVLQLQFPVQPIICCSPQEEQRARELVRMLNREALIVSGSIRRTCAVLQGCELFLGNDSGAAHLAAAMGCKVVVVSHHGPDSDRNHPHSPERFSPWCDKSIVLAPETWTVAGRRGEGTEPGIESISATVAASALIHLIRAGVVREDFTLSRTLKSRDRLHAELCSIPMPSLEEAVQV